jgi:hypothetical protein
MVTVNQLSRMMLEYKRHKLSFEKWQEQNQHKIGTPEYDEYVQNFEKWMEVVSNSVEEYLSSIIDQVANENLDLKLNAILETIPMEVFVKVMRKLCKKDKSVFKLAKKVSRLFSLF